MKKSIGGEMNMPHDSESRTSRSQDCSAQGATLVGVGINVLQQAWTEFSAHVAGFDGLMCNLMLLR